MKLTCPKSIITDNLLLYFDTTNPLSWDGNTLTSLYKWKNAKVNNLNLPDWGLSAFDNGRVNNMLSGLTLTTSDNRVKLYRVGYNVITNHTGYTQTIISGVTGNTIVITGVTAKISYSGMTITGITSSLVGNYILLNSGCFQGFFKLWGYDFELLPIRYNYGFTVENLLYLTPESKGIFYLMGTRAEDKYNLPFSGETGISGITSINVVNNDNCTYEHKSKIDYQYKLSGITTSLGNHLDSYEKQSTFRDAFRMYETQLHVEIDKQPKQIDNLKNNIISFELTSENKLAYRYINSRGNVIYNESPNFYYITGWTAISISYMPDILLKDDTINEDINCHPLRKGTLSFYINGRLFWQITGIEEPWFKHLYNDKEKQLGVPFNISWGGSFGLEHSYHFNQKTINQIALIVQDPTKNNLLIQQNFNNNFIGGIQKMRFYDRPLTQAEILSNLIADTGSNPNYNLSITNGGRIIYNYNNNSTAAFTQEEQWTNGINPDEIIEPNDYL